MQGAVGRRVLLWAAAGVGVLVALGVGLYWHFGNVGATTSFDGSHSYRVTWDVTMQGCGIPRYLVPRDDPQSQDTVLLDPGVDGGTGDMHGTVSITLGPGSWVVGSAVAIPATCGHGGTTNLTLVRDDGKVIVVEGPSPSQ